MNAPAGTMRSIPMADADYAPAPIEARWHARWAQAEAFATPPPPDDREPAYVFAGSLSPAEDLQIGHIRGYTIADAHARFLRARGRAVLFSLGFEACGPSIENRARQRGVPPNEWVARRCARLRDQLQALGCSIDWGRSFVSSEPEQHRWTHRMFLALVEHGLIYRHAGSDGGWRLRVTAYVRDGERDLEALPGWDEAALAAQREVLGRVDGVELDASTFDGTLLTVFTPHPDAIAQAAFVAVASDHPDAERWRAGAFATVPGVAGVLPIVVSEAVGARFGTTAVLGIPARDPADAAIAKRLPEPAGTTWRASRTGATPRPAARWRVRDVAISSQSEVWSWLALCVPPGERDEELPGHPEYARWLPATQLVRCANAGEETLRQRVLAKALCDAGQLPELPGREPFAGALTHGAVRLDDRAPNTRFGDVSKPDALLATVGADTLRLALLHAASPGTAFAWNDQPLRHCNNFLRSLHGYAAQRLRAWSPRSSPAAGAPGTTSDAAAANGVSPLASIDASDKLRRRLARWCRVACEKATGNLERLEMQRAAHNAMLLFTRIQDFEQRALDRRGGELEPADREGIVAALLLLVQMLAPLTPHIAEELWSLAGHTTLVSDAPWAWPIGP
ncbi:MAG TPA: class I tRNA ligase family protein [Solirubrobacteraceae bacterium]|nr:class I tRNA ligase family protein [Solirubrobacteraceae bacterium]